MRFAFTKEKTGSCAEGLSEDSRDRKLLQELR